LITPKNPPCRFACHAAKRAKSFSGIHRVFPVEIRKSEVEQQAKVLRLKELTDAGKTVPSIETLHLEPAERERLLKQIFTELGTNQTLVLQAAAMVPDTNTATLVSTNTLAGQGGQARAATVMRRAARKSPAATESKGATALMAVVAKSSATGKPSSPAHQQLPAAPDGAPLTLDQIEAKLLSAIQVSGDEQCDLIKRRAQTVQSYILKTEKVAAERLFIVAPKSAGASAKGEHRVNLSLD
jgi:hypothetical protein